MESFQKTCFSVDSNVTRLLSSIFFKTLSENVSTRTGTQERRLSPDLHAENVDERALPVVSRRLGSVLHCVRVMSKLALLGRAERQPIEPAIAAVIEAGVPFVPHEPTPN